MALAPHRLQCYAKLYTKIGIGNTLHYFTWVLLNIETKLKENIIFLFPLELHYVSTQRSDVQGRRKSGR